MELYLIIKAIRKHVNLSQEEFANKLGITRSNLSQMEIGRNTPSVALLNDIANIFRINISVVFQMMNAKEEDLHQLLPLLSFKNDCNLNCNPYCNLSNDSALNSGKTNGIETTDSEGKESPVFLSVGGKTNSTNAVGKRPEIQILHHPKVADKIITQQTIPVYNVEAAANLKTVFSNKDQNILGEITMPDIPRCDGAIYVRGDSMYPLLKSGDIVGYKEIMDFQNVIFGEMYIVSYDIEGDEYVCVKYVNHSDRDGYYKLVSYNPHHDPKDIPISRISAMALVKFSIRMNTII